MMKSFLVWFLCACCVIGCQKQTVQVDVLGETAVPGGKKYIVNGGTGSTDVFYSDLQGNQLSATSNVVKIPIREKCEEQQVPVKAPQSFPEVKKEKEVADIDATFRYEFESFQNYILASAGKVSEVYYRTEVSIPPRPPKIELTKSSDQIELCCDKQLTFKIKVKNVGGDDAYNIVLRDVIPAHVDYIEGSAGITPYLSDVSLERDKDGVAESVLWKIPGPIGPGQEGEAFYSVTCPKSRPNLVCQIRFEPKVLAPNQAGKVTCIVSNQGKGEALAANLVILVPEGIEHEGDAKGKRLFLAVGSLAPGQKAEKTFSVVRREGKQEGILADVTAANWEGCQCLPLVTPLLKVDKSGPHKVNDYVPLEYTIAVRNLSVHKAPATNCILTDKLPPFTIFQSAGQGGVYDPKGHQVTWKLGTLMPGDLRACTVAIMPQKLMRYTDEAWVTCDEGIKVTDNATTIVTGIPAIQISQYDTIDPVESKEQTAYVIEIRNQGLEPLTEVEVEDSIPSISTFESAKGKDHEGKEISHRRADGKVLFSIPSIPAKSRVLLEIKVKFADKGDTKNSIRVKCKEFKKWILCEEPTIVY